MDSPFSRSSALQDRQNREAAEKQNDDGAAQGRRADAEERSNPDEEKMK
jgi:hypothetical protein